MVLLFSLFGCSLLGVETLDLDAELDDLTNPYVVQSWVVGIAPLGDGMEIASSTWSQSALALACVGNASELVEVGEFPIQGASVDVDGAGSKARLLETDAGAYSGSSQDGLAYEPGAEATLTVVDGDEPHSVRMDLPSAPDVEIEVQQPLGEPLTIDISGMGYDGLLAVVVDLTTQEILFDNTPTDPVGILDFLNGERPQVVEVPGETFATESLYAVGIGGLVRVEDDGFTGFNTELSRVMAGQVRFYGIVTTPDE